MHNAADQKGISKAWIILIIISAGLLFIGGGVLFALFHISENRFADTELPDWADAYATIEDARVTGEHIDVMEDSNGFRDYRVSYSYTITFMTSKGKVTFQDSGTNSGRTDGNSIPLSAYEIYKPGEEYAICYNPGEPKNYRFGSKAENTARAKSPVMPILSAVFCLIGVCAIVVGPLLVKKIGSKGPGNWNI